MTSGPAGQTYLFLQGPVSPFFPMLARALEARGHRVLRINLCFGDWLTWRGGAASDYRGTLEAWPEHVRALMKREGVTDLLLLGEQRPYHRAAALEARLQGIAVTVTDFGYLRPDWLVLEQDGLHGLSRMPREPEAIRTLAKAFPEPDLTRRFRDSFLAQAAWDVAYQLSTYWLSPIFYPRYRTHHIHNPVALHLGTGWRLFNGRRNRREAMEEVARVEASGEPYWLFPMQMELDYSIRAYSPFKDMIGPLREVIASFALRVERGRLIVKLHPLDPGLRNWRRLISGIARDAGVGDRVSFIDGGDLDALIRGSEGVVVINSTVGLMALQAGRPTKVLGTAVYDVRGLTFQGGLEAFWTGGTGPDMALLADFVRAAAGAVHIRGVYYREPGLGAAVEAAAARLEKPASELMEKRLKGVMTADEPPHAARPAARLSAGRA